METNRQFRNDFKNDLLIRLAKRTNELENLPYGLSAMPSINVISKWYIDSFTELYNYKDTESVDGLKVILNKIYERHTNTNNMVSEGIKELNTNLSSRYNLGLNVKSLSISIAL